MNNKNNDYHINRYIERIKKGITGFDSIGPIEWKNIIKNKFLDDIRNGISSDNVTNALVNYYIDEIKKGRLNIDDVEKEAPANNVDRLNNTIK